MSTQPGESALAPAVSATEYAVNVVRAVAVPSTASGHADMGALNGHGNARSLARILSTIALGGESKGVRLLNSASIDMIFDEQNNDVDLVLGVPFRRGIGYALPRLGTVPGIPDGRICFWGGWGGSMTEMDLVRRMTFTYMMNKMGPGIIVYDS